jgi:cysteinyl-tRNA synthetase
LLEKANNDIIIIIIKNMIKIYNTLSQKKEIFKPLNKKEVKMYTCGLTVYNYGHLGNYRSFICADIIRRYLEYRGYKVKYVKNITDVGHFTEDDSILVQDKMLLAAKREKKSAKEIAQFYTKAFFEDEKKLKIKKADVYPRASKHIKEMIDLIKILLKKGYAYQTPSSAKQNEVRDEMKSQRSSDGIYFNVPKFKKYGKLSGNTINKLKRGVRIEPNPEKKDPTDFALWKFTKPEDLMKWSSPWGQGFPGWHIECSAMAKKHLGKELDIHTGGEDNIFPHHEDEIAQSEAVFNKKFVKYWIHVRHLLVNKEKMSKSKENFYTIKDLEKRGYDPLLFRILVLNSHHRSKMNFTFRGLEQAKKNLKKINEFMEKIQNANFKSQNYNTKFKISKFQKDFEKAMNDDFNTSKAMAVIFKLINKGNSLIAQNLLNKTDAKEILNFLKKIDKIFGFIFGKKIKEKIPKDVLELVKEREKSRKKGDWQRADYLREKVKKLGYLIEDRENKFKIKKI